VRILGCGSQLREKQQKEKKDWGVYISPPCIPFFVFIDSPPKRKEKDFLLKKSDILKLTQYQSLVIQRVRFNEKPAKKLIIELSIK
jgi:hypothetical protein